MVPWAGLELGPGFDVLDAAEGPATWPTEADLAGLVGTVPLRGVEGVSTWREVELRRCDTGGGVFARRAGGGVLGTSDEFKLCVEPAPDALTEVDLPDPRWVVVMGPDPPD